MTGPLVVKKVPVHATNYTKGRRGHMPRAIVVHLMDGSLAGTDAWFGRELAAPVSAHYGIGKNGTVNKYVEEGDTAFHAGRVYQAKWFPAALGVNPNLFTIGIEHEGRVEDDWSEAMLTASARLIADICRRWSIPVDRFHIVGHREIFAGKSCPGSKCPLDELVSRAAVIVP